MTKTRCEFPVGFFSGLNTIHVHVDGGTVEPLVLGIVRNLNSRGIPSKLTSIRDAVAGPQRLDLPPTYNSHTPGEAGRERLEFFSTSLFRDHETAVREIKGLLTDLHSTNGLVVEAEMVVAKIQDEVYWTSKELNDIPMIHSSEVGFYRSNTLPIEVHYGCDIAKKDAWENTPPFSLDEFLAICSELEIRVGGWFLFEKPDYWAYRSNLFEDSIPQERLRKQVADLTQRITCIGGDLGIVPTVKALVERSLGVWKTPLTLWRPTSKLKDFRGPEELATWEESVQNLESFWVVAPNFFGDLNEDIYRAMVQNLREGVEYTYFLRSFADVQRLRQFAKRLARDVPYVNEYIKPILLSSCKSDHTVFPFEGEFFISNPLQPNAQGYCLMRDEQKTLTGGRLLKPERLSELTTILSFLIEPSRDVQGLSIPIIQITKPVARAVMYTDLKDSTRFQEQFGDDAWESVLIDYDLTVAKLVSQLEGEVIKNLGDGYLIVFEQAGDALKCALSLQRAIHVHNQQIPNSRAIPLQRIALDFGYVTRVLRAHGFDYTGKTLSRCSRLIQTAQDNQVLLLDTFLNAVRASFPFVWLNTKIKSKGTIQFKGLWETYEMWEFEWQD